MRRNKICGLVGAAGKLTYKDEKAFKTLLILDVLRGEHSTGIASIGTDSSVLIAKSVGDPFQLFDTKLSEDIFKRANRVLIGHNRYATTGKINRRNAHPFELGHIVGAHNGTLTNKHNLPDSHKFDVDSEALYNAIATIGVEKAMSLASGAWALTWFNNEDDTINFLRNNERPLYFCYGETDDVIFWASERWMLEIALSKNEIKHQKIIQFTENILHSFKIKFPNGELEKPVLKSVKGKQLETYIPKKPVGVSSHLGLVQPTTTDPYLGIQSTFKIQGVGIDDENVEYLDLVDEAHLSKIIRLYHGKQKYLKDKIGYSFRGRVFSVRKATSGYLIYKVTIESPPFRQKGHLTNVKTAPKDKQGNSISVEEHDKHYATCCWCSSNVEYGEEGAQYINRETGIICNSCKNDPTVMSFL